MFEYIDSMRKPLKYVFATLLFGIMSQMCTLQRPIKQQIFFYPKQKTEKALWPLFRMQATTKI